jgi:hypothetical protein
MSYPCPACGFEVFDEPAGSYEICPVCNWEDDEVQLRFPTTAVGANKESLFEKQQTILHRLPLQILVHNGFERCADWRPLTPADLTIMGSTPSTGVEYFGSWGEDEPVYYWLKTGQDDDQRRQ